MQTTSAEHCCVFITGASSGIGKACALHLDRLGFPIIAGVRKQADADALRQEASQGLKTVFLDVADSASIETAAAAVAALTGGSLFGLINNAGIAFGGPLEIISVQDIRGLMDVNIAGVLTVTKAFLPMLRQGRGRIINMGSTSGILALPCLSAYAASKFALKGLSDALRLELKPVGVSVSLLEIGNVETPIWE
jgi:NAD(P)-dependent dehydrogenase (short-subunit alcohol dehydrogenase family)